MVIPIDIERSAAVMIGEHGDAAFDTAKERAEELRAKGAGQGAATFEKIAEAIKYLQNLSNDNEPS